MEYGIKNFKIDMWYKIPVLVGVIGFFISLTVPIQGIDNTDMTLISSGIALIGLGEWKNWRSTIKFKKANVYTGPAMLIPILKRDRDIVAHLIMLLGIFLILQGIFHVV